MNKGRLFIVSGPSGSGKDTILAELFKICPEIKFSISSITRDMRENEIPGEKYNFISKEQFENMIKHDELLEYNRFVGNYYGTPKEPVIKAIEDGCDIIVEVDVNGAAQIRKEVPDCTSIFILPPSLETLKVRLKGRGTESDDKINARLSCALDEIKRAEEYDYIVVNDNLFESVSELCNIIKLDRLKTDRNINLIEKILNE
ncbi:MAG: guanylate kinase [Clostridia bacterium]|nr:guanylate kinase [Clostridia bacterium]